MFNSYEDRALSEHRGSALLIKKENGKYSIFIPVEGTGENGSTPAELDKTSIGNRQSSSEEGRQSNPQKTLPFFSHRDNFRVLRKYDGKECEFLRLLPDFTGFKYRGKPSMMANNTDVGSLEQGQLTITPTGIDEYVDNCYDLVEDTAIINSAIPDVLRIKKGGTEVINVTTIPADATIETKSETVGVATINFTSGKATITGVEEGSAILTITTKKTGFASLTRSIMVIVEGTTEA